MALKLFYSMLSIKMTPFQGFRTDHLIAQHVSNEPNSPYRQMIKKKIKSVILLFALLIFLAVLQKWCLCSGM